MTPRTYIRGLDLRVNTNDLSTQSFDRSEDSYLRGRYFEANCTVAETVGEFVFISAAPSGGIFTVSTADITDTTTFPVIGVIAEKATSTRCFVQREGILNVSSFPSSIVLVPGDKYWVGSDSELTNTLPLPGAGIYVVQLVGQAVSTTELIMAQGVLPVVRRA